MGRIVNGGKIIKAKYFFRESVGFSPAVLDPSADSGLDGPVPPLQVVLPASLSPIWLPPPLPASVHSPASLPSAFVPAGLKTRIQIQFKVQPSLHLMCGSGSQLWMVML